MKRSLRFHRAAPGLWLFLIGWLGGCEKPLPEFDGPPNFVIIYSADHRYDALSTAGNAAVRTPFLDAMAEQGLRFTVASVTQPLPTPSRAALLTGRYGSANGVSRAGRGVLDTDQPLLARILRDTGYQTAYIGKWHFRNTPDALGFDRATYYDRNGPRYDRRVIEEGEEKTASGTIDVYSASQAIQYLQEVSNGQAPFLLMVHTQLPYLDPAAEVDTLLMATNPYDPALLPLPASWENDLSRKPPYLQEALSRTQARNYGYDTPDGIRSHLARYYAATTAMDAAVGQILDAVQSLGLQQNTYVFFMGDNGILLGEHSLTTRVLPYDPAVRVPLIVCGPGIEPGINDELVLNIDLTPTVLDLAGIEIPDAVQGRSLRPLLFDTATSWRTAVLYETPSPQLGSWPFYAVRTRNWKYVQTYDPAETDRLVFEELYNLADDPHEMVNLSDENSAVRTHLARTLDSLRVQVLPVE